MAELVCTPCYKSYNSLDLELHVLGLPDNVQWIKVDIEYTGYLDNNTWCKSVEDKKLRLDRNDNNFDWERMFLNKILPEAKCLCFVVCISVTDIHYFESNFRHPKLHYT